MMSVLDRATPADIRLDPFPHLVVHGALDADLYEQLAAGFRQPGVMTRLGTPGKYAYRARDLLADGGLGPSWHAFAARHTSPAFFDQFLALFGPIIRALHPDLERRLGKPLEALRTGARFVAPSPEIALEAQCILSEPAGAPVPIIGPHLDRTVALYAGLYYFRDDGDDSTGGDLELYRFRPGCRGYVEGTRRVPDRLVERVAVVPYEKNTLVLFPHSPDAVHGVSTWSPAGHPRRHVNFVGEFATDVYSLAPYPSLPSTEV